MQPMPKKLSSNGFSVVEVVVALLVVVALGLGGFFVWQHNKDDSSKDKSSNTNQSSGNSSEQQAGEDKNSDPSEGGKYLVIKEWGVRFLLPESLHDDVTYGKRSVSSTNQEAVSFEVGKIASLPGSNCKLVEQSDGSGKSGGIGVTLVRSPETVPATEGIGEPVLTTPNDQYYFYVAPSKGLCAGSANEQLELDAASSLEESLKKVEEVPQQ